jgi:hypothetical protein
MEFIMYCGAGRFRDVNYDINKLAAFLPHQPCRYWGMLDVLSRVVASGYHRWIAVVGGSASP